MKLVFATHNLNKFKEVQSLLPPTIQLLSLTDIDCHDDIPETANTIEGNALLKVAYVKEKYGLDCFADDTGLEVTSLNNAPGVYSARYAGVGATDQSNIEKLLDKMSKIQDRKARFKTVIALTYMGEKQLFEGICQGLILSQARGVKGFGYDPVFLPDGKNQTFAEMTLQEKSSIGHRGKAMQQLITYLEQV
ncbi:non-canonical purine NTP diphosphatase [Flavobacteriaceae bacterium]|nr:non-canonical purine NTP diphosphatase [Flavobacteriaceae bacterium]